MRIMVCARWFDSTRRHMKEKWVKCSDMMPPPGKQVVVYAGDGQGLGVGKSYEFNGKVEWLYIGGVVADFVTHWRYLPYPKNK